MINILLRAVECRQYIDFLHLFGPITQKRNPRHFFSRHHPPPLNWPKTHRKHKKYQFLFKLPEVSFWPIGQKLARPQNVTQVGYVSNPTL